MTLPSPTAAVLAEALKDAEAEYRAAQQAGEPERYAAAKARLEALEQAALLKASADA